MLPLWWNKGRQFGEHGSKYWFLSMEECKKENSFNQNVDCLLVGAIPEKVG